MRNKNGNRVTIITIVIANRGLPEILSSIFGVCNKLLSFIKRKL